MLRGFLLALTSEESETVAKHRKRYKLDSQEMERSDSMGMELTFQVDSWRNTTMKREGRPQQRGASFACILSCGNRGLKIESATLVLIF